MISWWTIYLLVWGWLYVGELFCVGRKSPVSGQKLGKFYGMELPRVGAFTEKWGSRYRNPVQILGEKCQIYVKSGN